MIHLTSRMAYKSSNVLSGLAHRRSWRRLQGESCALRQRGLADGTWANRISHLRSYTSFTCYYGVPDFPISLGVLLRFIALLARGPYAFNSASNMLGSLRWFSVLLDPSADKIFDSALVSISLKGLKAQLSRPVLQKLPFCVPHLAAFYSSLDMADPKQLAGWCAMLLAFFGCFRLSNLVPAAKDKFDPLKNLKRDDIRFSDNFVMVFYKWSKTNQNSSRVSWIPICSVKDDRFNIQKHLKLLFSSVNVSNSSPLFAYSKHSFHSRYSLIRILDKCVFKAGLSLPDYSWHSFRRGAAVFAFELGLADSAVQLLGDWSSDAFKCYLEFAFTKKADVAEEIANSFDLYTKSL